MQICDDIVTVVVVVAKLPPIHDQNIGSLRCTHLLYVSAQELRFLVNFMVIFVEISEFHVFTFFFSQNLKFFG